MPSDNPSNIPDGGDIAFPSTAANNGSFGRISDTQFTLVSAGMYLVQFQVPITGTGKLVVTLNNVELPFTVTGRSGGSSQIDGVCIVSTKAANTILTIRYPVGEPGPLAVTEATPKTKPLSAHLVILRLS